MPPTARPVLFALLLGLVGCAARWEPAIPLADPASDIGAGNARITVERTQTALYLGAPANVAINEQRAGGLWRGDRVVVDVPAGQTTISVSSPGNPGRWTTRVPTVSGGRYQIELGVRGASYMPALMFGYLGSALDAASNPEQGGIFQLTVVSADPPIGATRAAQTAPAPTSPEARREALEELRRLRRDGLISEEVYREGQRRSLAQ
jgi:hypothetical protein